MKKRTNLLIAACFLSGVMMLTGCKDDVDPTTPAVTTAPVTEVTMTSAKTGGSVTENGGAEVTARGVCWGTQQEPTISGNFTTDGTGLGDFTSELTGLSHSTTYYVRAYATNTVGTTYGEEETFTTTSPGMATLTTSPVTEVTMTSAKSGGNVTNNGGSEVTARGVCWGIEPAPVISGNHTTDGAGLGDFTSEITGLANGTTYYVRAYATNAIGTNYGEEVTFTTTSPALATVTTAALTNVTSTTAVSGGNVTADGGGAVTERGVVWGIAPNPTVGGTSRTTNGNGTGQFTSNITGLTNGTVYYVRSYARNSVGVAYGPELTFITPVTDVEGNVYKTTKIGTQVWMAENLRVTRFRNNTPIPNVRDSLTWMSLTTPAYVWYRNNSANRQDGALYTWFAVGTNNLCPTGWHVPTNDEWHTMERAIGIPADTVGLWGWRGNGAATKLKDSVGWRTGNGNNSTGFSAKGAGYRAWSDSQFRGLLEIGYWWTATDDAINHKPDVAWYRRIDGTSTMVYKASTGKTGGKSVRCVKN